MVISDVLHLHESRMRRVCRCRPEHCRGPDCGDISRPPSLTLTVFQGILRPMHEKTSAGSRCPNPARRWQMEALGSDAVEIPMGGR